jgi:hypothetical protein
LAGALLAAAAAPAKMKAEAITPKPMMINEPLGMAIIELQHKLTMVI